MAVIKYGAVVTSILGKLGGHIFSNCNSGAILYTNARKKNTKTAYWELSKTAIRTLATTWNGFTQAVRISWNVSAGTVILVNRYGDNFNPTGYQWFVYMNQRFVNSTFSLILTPHPKLDFFRAFGGIVSVDTSIQVVNIASILPVVGAGRYFVYVVITKNGNDLGTHPHWIMVHSSTNYAMASYFIYNAIKLRFPSLFRVGNYVFLKIINQDNVNGAVATYGAITNCQIT